MKRRFLKLFTFMLSSVIAFGGLCLAVTSCTTTNSTVNTTDPDTSSDDGTGDNLDDEIPSGDDDNDTDNGDSGNNNDNDQNDGDNQNDNDDDQNNNDDQNDEDEETPSSGIHGDHEDTEGWTALSTSSSTFEISSDGKYYLSNETQLNISVTDGDVALCLNGQTLKPYSNERDNYQINVSGGSLTLCDCVGTGVITGSTRQVVFMRGGNFIMEGGTIIGNDGTILYTAGMAVYLQINSNATFTMKGGTITSNSALMGAAVILYNTTTFNMEGGTIENNTNVGDNIAYSSIYMYGGTFNMSGGFLGDYVYSGNAGSTYMYGGYLNETSKDTIDETWLRDSSNNSYKIVSVDEAVKDGYNYSIVAS